jgi:hypothetical protein
MNIKSLKNKPIAVIVMIFLMALPALFLVAPVHASPDATGTISAVFVNASTGVGLGNTLTLPASAVGTQVTVQLYVAGASNLAGVKTDISWNNAVLNLVTVGQGDTINGGFSGYTGTPNNGGYYPNDFIAYSSSTISRGTYKETDVSVLFSGSTSTEWQVDGNGNGFVSGGISEVRTDGSVTPLTSGVYATLTFNIVGQGNSNIALANGIASNPDNPIVNTPTTTTSATITVGSALSLPEYPMGAILALTACFAAFVAFAAVKTRISIPSISKRIA